MPNQEAPRGWRWNQKMSRISRIERLQRGHEPRFNQSSLEHTLQKVCPHGMNAAPFFLTMHTQHTESFPSTPPFSLSFSFSVIIVVSSSPPSVSSSNLINETLNGVPGAVVVPATVPTTVSVGPTVATLSGSCDARRCLSAANAAAKFIPEPDETGLTQSGSGLWPGGAWPRPTSITTTSSSSSSSSPSTTMLLSLTLVPPKTQVYRWSVGLLPWVWINGVMFGWLNEIGVCSPWVWVCRCGSGIYSPWVCCHGFESMVLGLGSMVLLNLY